MYMNQMNQKSKTINNNDQMDIKDLYIFLWSKKILISFIILIFSIASIFYAISLPNIYTSTAILAPTKGDSDSYSSLSSFGGIASIAGINLPSASTNNTDIAIKTLTSLKFFEESFLSKIDLEDLMAVESWDPAINKIYYDNNLYDDKENNWVREVSYPKKIKPSPQESHLVFMADHLKMQRDQDNGFVTISIDHKSPYLAKDWLNIIIKEINKSLRDKQKQKSILAVNYLEKQIIATNLSEIKQGLSSLMQQEIEKLMLIESNEDYIFEFIDLPVVPELKSSPSRSLICIIGMLLGLIIGVFSALISPIFKNYKE